MADLPAPFGEGGVVPKCDEFPKRVRITEGDDDEQKAVYKDYGWMLIVYIFNNTEDTVDFTNPYNGKSGTIQKRRREADKSIGWIPKAESGTDKRYLISYTNNKLEKRVTINIKDLGDWMASFYSVGVYEATRSVKPDTCWVELEIILENGGFRVNELTTGTQRGRELFIGGSTRMPLDESSEGHTAYFGTGFLDIVGDNEEDLKTDKTDEELRLFSTDFGQIYIEKIVNNSDALVHYYNAEYDVSGDMEPGESNSQECQGYLPFKNRYEIKYYNTKMKQEKTIKIKDLEFNWLASFYQEDDLEDIRELIPKDMATLAMVTLDIRNDGYHAYVGDENKGGLFWQPI